MQLRKKFAKNNAHCNFSWALIFVGAVILGIAGIIFQVNRNDAPPSVQEVHNVRPANRPSIEKPKPNEFDSYTVAEDLPRYLFIPKLSVKTIVKPVGLTKDNQIDVPKNVFEVGWYNGGAKPGYAGAMLMEGHVSSDSVAGVFYNLKELRQDDTLTVERGDGAQLTYRVVKVRTYDVHNVDMAAALSPVSAKPGLNLITCTGSVIKGTHNYDKRLVVFTEQVQG